MKVFGFMKEQQNIDGHEIPANAVYGRLNLSYTDKHFTGKTRPIFDKNGYPVFQADGTPATRRVYKLIQKKVEVTYSVEDLFPVTMKDGEYFRAWYKIGRDGKWHEDVLCVNQIARELNKFIAGKLQAYCSANNKTLFDLCTGVKSVKTDSNRKKHQMAKSTVTRRKVQTADNMVFRGRMCYALNATVITDGVRPKETINKSVIASHKGAFGVKPTVDTAEKVSGTQSAIGFAVVGTKVNRVVYTNRAVAEQAARDCKSHYLVGGTFDNIERLVDSGKLEKSVDFSSDTFIVSRR